MEKEKPEGQNYSMLGKKSTTLDIDIFNMNYSNIHWFYRLNYNQPVLKKHHGSQSESMFTPNFTELQVKPGGRAKPCTYAYICKPHSYVNPLKFL